MTSVDGEKDYFWAVSDLHLHPSRPELLDHFQSFLRDARQCTNRLMILGDMFDYWIGPPDYHDPEYGTVLDMLEHAAEDGLQVEFIGGNRDFLAERDLGEISGIQTHGIQRSFSIRNQNWLVLHGDSLNRTDTVYHLYRRIRRNRMLQDAVRSLPGPVKDLLIESFRTYSEATTEDLPAEEEISPYLVKSLFRAGVDHLVCGHIHSPLRVRYNLDGVLRHLWVLGDWYRFDNCYFLRHHPDREVRLQFFSDTFR